MQNAEQAAVDATGLHHTLLLAADSSAPVVYLVHGRAGSARVMWAFRRTLPPEINIIAPEAFLPDPVGGMSWWNVTSGQRHSQADLDLATGKLNDFISGAEEYYGLKPSKRIAIGFSQGAGLLSVVTQTTDTLSAVALLAGFVITLSEELSVARARIPVFMANGTQDDIVPVQKARDGAEYLKALGYPVTYVEEDAGHKVGIKGMRELKEWLSLQT